MNLKENKLIKRNSNVELLRILCMLAIISSHYVSHGLGDVQLEGMNRYIEEFLYMWPRISVNCFGILTGFYLVDNAKNLKEKILDLCSSRWFYSVAISGLMFFFDMSQRNFDYSFDYFASAFFPIITFRHNYVTNFLILYMMIPFINGMIKNLDNKEYKGLIIFLILVLSVWPTLLRLVSLYKNGTFSYLGWMILLYLLGGYLKRNKGNGLLWRKPVENGIFWILLTLVFHFCVEPKIFWIREGYFTGNLFSFIALMCSISIVIFCVSLPERHSRIINFISASNFAVLLIHDDPLIRGFLWHKILNVTKKYDGIWFIYNAMMIIILIYITCIVIDKIYVYGIKKIFKYIFKV
ncbi:MAG: hypothetical protein HFI29_11070 [Lachnospiraceae bacterium]|nr:hypothetical protein [Lachnospiraceae bacterium]